MMKEVGGLKKSEKEKISSFETTEPISYSSPREHKTQPQKLKTFGVHFKSGIFLLLDYTFSKSDAGCLQSGQMKSSGSSSPSYSYPQTVQRQTVFAFSFFCGFGFILL